MGFWIEELECCDFNSKLNYIDKVVFLFKVIYFNGIYKLVEKQCGFVGKYKQVDVYGLYVEGEDFCWIKVKKRVEVDIVCCVEDEYECQCRLVRSWCIGFVVYSNVSGER